MMTANKHLFIYFEIYKLVLDKHMEKVKTIYKC